MNNKHIETSVVAEDATIVGDIEFVGTMIVEGKLEGNLKGADMIVQRTGSVSGTLDVNSINCHGKIDGELQAKELIAHGSAQLDGQIHTQTLEVAPGAKMNGQLNMSTAVTEKTPTISAPQPKRGQSAAKPPLPKGEGTKLSDLVLD